MKDNGIDPKCLTLYAVVLKSEGYTPGVRFFHHDLYKRWVELRYKVFNTEEQAMKFVDKHIKEMDWEFMSTNFAEFSEQYVRKYFKYFFVDILCQFYNFSDDFMREYKDELDWKSICEYHHNLNFEFIKEMKDYVDYEQLENNFYINGYKLEQVFKNLKRTINTIK